MREPIRSLVISLPAPDHYVAELRREFPEIEIASVKPDQLTHALETADAVVAWSIPEEAIQRAPKLKWIHRGAAGVEDLITPTLLKSDIVLTNSSGVHATNIAEHVIACVLAFARGFPTLFRMKEAHEWDGNQVERVFELTGQTVLLAGLGDIGQAVASRARALGMDTIGVRRHPHMPRPDDVETMVSSERLHEVLASADHVVDTLPLTSETSRLFDASAFAAMRPGSYFYNIGRGKTVDTGALVEALQSGHLAGAALDVTDPEPLPADSPLWDMKNVIITAHTAGRTPNMWPRVFKLVENNLRRYQAGEPLINVVDVESGY